MISSDNNKFMFNEKIDHLLLDVYYAYKFILRFFKELFKRPYHFKEVIYQSYEVGVKSLALISLTGFIIGVVFTKQSRPPLEDVGATSWLPNLVGIAMIKAMGPIMTSLICAGRVGSSIGAELGSMKVSEQIDAMEVSAINPFKYLVVTRVVATTIMVPLLSVYCSFVGLFGSFLNSYSNEAISFVAYYNNALINISFFDLSVSIVKAVIFGFTIGIVGCYKGFHATQGTRGVGKAANQAVVLTMFLIFIEEIVLVQMANWFQHY